VKYTLPNLFLYWMLPVRGKLYEAKAGAKAEDAYVKATLRDLLAGYVAAADAPILFFAGELAEIYPDAKIICTTRDADKWWVSYQELVGAIDRPGQNFMNLALPSLRYHLSWKLGIVERFALTPNFSDLPKAVS
jgi:Sulfotransferase domain